MIIDNKYSAIASVYDEFTPDFWDTKHNFLADYFKQEIKKKSVLDLGCGTGILLEYYKQYIDYYIGVDHSMEMLKIASMKYPEYNFINDDITKFLKNDYKFNIITSLFDTINHLLEKRQWEKLFFNVSHMLKNDGVFIFDICTKNDLENNWPFYINIIIKEDLIIISNGEIDIETNISKIHHNYFIKNNDNSTYNKKYECIEHISFEISDIIIMLKNVNFKNIQIFDLDTKNSITNDTTVAVFICKK